MITTAPSNCQQLLALLEGEAKEHKFVADVFRKINIRISRKAEAKFDETNRLIFIVKREMHDDVYTGADVIKNSTSSPSL